MNFSNSSFFIILKLKTQPQTVQHDALLQTLKLTLRTEVLGRITRYTILLFCALQR